MCIVESREHAHLRKLGDTREEHEAQVGVGKLEDGIECLERLTVMILNEHLVVTDTGFQSRVHRVKHGFVVFVNEHYAGLTRLYMSLMQHVGQAPAGLVGSWLHAILLFPFDQIAIERLLQGIRLSIVGTIEVDLEDGISLPFLL